MTSPLVLAALATLAAACGPRPTNATVYGRSHSDERIADAAAEELGCPSESIEVQEIGSPLVRVHHEQVRVRLASAPAARAQAVGARRGA